MDYIYKQGDKEILVEYEKRNISDPVVDQLIMLRKEQKKTQQDIADATGMQRSNIARIEAKKYTPTLEVLMRYANCLGMEVDVTLKKK